MNSLISLKNAFKNFDSRGAWALKDVDLELFPSQVLGIMGPSGAGKSTLLNVLRDELPLDQGERLSRVEKEQISLFDPLLREPQLENLACAEFIASKSKEFSEKERNFQRSLMESFALESCSEKLICQLSTGERVRAYLIRQLASHPKVILIDEGLSALDPNTRLDLLLDLRDYVQEASLSFTAARKNLLI